MTNIYDDAARDFPEVYNLVTLSLARKLPFFKFMPPYFRQNYIERAKEITHEVIKEYLDDNADQFNGQSSLSTLKFLIAKDVDYTFVDNVVSEHIQTILHPQKTPHKSK